MFIGFITASSLAQTMPATAGATGATTTPANAAAGGLGPDEMKAIDDLRTGLVDALNRRDWDKVMTYLDNDIVVTWTNAEVSHGPAEVRAYCERMMSGPNAIVASASAAPVIEGRKLYGDNVLISYGTLGDKFKLNDGTEFTLNSRFSSLLVKENGAWHLKGFHASADVFDNPVQTIVVKKTAMWSGIIGGLIGLILGIIGSMFFRRKKAV